MNKTLPNGEQAINGRGAGGGGLNWRGVIDQEGDIQYNINSNCDISLMIVFS